MAEPMDEGAPLAPLSLDILRTIMEMRIHHGLRTDDYDRYRQYCSRRLRRNFKVTGLLHSRPGSKQYEKIEITESMVTDVRYVEILLLYAERAWAHGESLKEANEERHKRGEEHEKNRFAKASKWADKLLAICRARCDETTTEMAEYYSYFLQGKALMAKKEWEGARDALWKSREGWRTMSEATQSDFSTMGTIGNRKEQLGEMFQAVETARKALGQVGGVGIDGSGEADLGRSKVDWAGMTAKAPEGRITELLDSASAALDEIQSTEMKESKLAEKYDTLLMTYTEAESAVAKLHKDNGDDEELFIILNYLNFRLKHTTCQRNLALAAAAAVKLAAASTYTPEFQAADISRLYELAGKDLREALDVPGLDEDSRQATEYDCGTIEAASLFWKGKAFWAHGKFSEALSFFHYARGDIEQHIKAFKGGRGSSTLTDTVLRMDAEELRGQVRAAVVEATAESEVVTDRLVDSAANLSLGGGSQAQAGPACLEDNLSRFVECSRLANIPGSLQPMAVRPIFYDIAGTFLTEEEMDVDPEPAAKKSAPSESSKPASASQPEGEKKGGWFSGWGRK